MTDKNITDLTLLLMYLTAWTEPVLQDPGREVVRTWKGYSVKALYDLHIEGLIDALGNGKSALITEAGREKARQLAKKHLGK